MILPVSTYPRTLEKLPPRSFNDIVQTLNALNEHLGVLSEEFVVIGGASLVLRQIRGIEKAPDIDLLVSDMAFERMLTMPGAVRKFPPKRALAAGATNFSAFIKNDWTLAPISGATHMGDGYYPISYGMYEYVDLDLVAGHAVAPLDHVWESKLALQRRKDMPHLRAIAAATGRPGNFPKPTYTGPHFDS